MNNPVNSVNAEMQIPNQARQEWREGVTTRPWSPERTVKAHERAARNNLRDEIVCSASNRKMQEPRIKSRGRKQLGPRFKAETANLRTTFNVDVVKQREFGEHLK